MWESARSTMTEIHLCPSTSRGRCITVSAAGAGGNVFKFVMDYENLTFPEAVKVLADRAGIELPEQDYSPGRSQKTGRSEGTDYGA